MHVDARVESIAASLSVRAPVAVVDETVDDDDDDSAKREGAKNGSGILRRESVIESGKSADGMMRCGVVAACDAALPPEASSLARMIPSSLSGDTAEVEDGSEKVDTPPLALPLPSPLPPPPSSLPTPPLLPQPSTNDMISSSNSARYVSRRGGMLFPGGRAGTRSVAAVTVEVDDAGDAVSLPFELPPAVDTVDDPFEEVLECDVAEDEALEGNVVPALDTPPLAPETLPEPRSFDDEPVVDVETVDEDDDIALSLLLATPCL